MIVPPEYSGREQSWLKHRVLEEYLRHWGHKVGSLATTQRMKLWFVDCFAGPWRSQDQDLRDTSIDIGLRALTAAHRTWVDAGADLELGAVFVEKDQRSFQELEEYLHRHHAGTSIDIHPLEGGFADHAQHIGRLLRQDPAFVFVDPTGFKGAAMDAIRPLLAPRMRDVLVNVMWEYASRFRAELHEHLAPFFHLDPSELTKQRSEEEMLVLYRSSLKRHCGVTYAADLRVPHPTRERTWFRLVVGGKSPAVLEVFRDVEAQVLGKEAGHARDAARRAAKEERDGVGQLGLFSAAASRVPLPDDGFAKQQADDSDNVLPRLLEILPERGAVPWREIWPRLLEELHVTLTQAAAIVGQAAKHGAVLVSPWGPKRRTVNKNDLVGRPDALDRDPGA